MGVHGVLGGYACHRSWSSKEKRRYYPLFQRKRGGGKRKAKLLSAVVVVLSWPMALVKEGEEELVGAVRDACTLLEGVLRCAPAQGATEKLLERLFCGEGLYLYAH